MTTVYVVTHSDYEEHSVEGVFDSKKLAEQFLEAIILVKDENKYYLNEYELNTPSLSKKDITYYWEVLVCLTKEELGKILNVEQSACWTKNINNVTSGFEYPNYLLERSFVSKNEALERANISYKNWLLRNNKSDGSIWFENKVYL